MQRRTFLQAIGAAGAFGLTAPWRVASARNRVAPEALTPLFDDLPQAITKAGMLNNQQVCEAEDGAAYPLLIGLGPRAEGILDQLHSTGAIPDDVGVYRTGWPALHTATYWLGQRLERTAVVMLLIDPDDPAARLGAQGWARQLIDAGIDLSVALVLESRGVDPDPAWGAALGLPVIEVRANAQGLAESKIVDAMLPALPFCQPALCSVDRSDLHAVLSTGSQGWTTAVYSRSPEDCGSAVARAFADLPLIRPAGVMVWITAGIEFTIGEFDAMLHALNMQVDDDAAAVISPYIDLGYAKGERLLSLTVIGD